LSLPAFPGNVISLCRVRRCCKTFRFFKYAQLPEDTCLIFLMPWHEESVRKQTRNPKKLHIIDPGLIGAFKVGADRDLGHKPQ
jgi:predicted AAA+ superfamily ATPase